MANRPTYNPNAFSIADAESRRNRAVTDMVEPGSVIKAVTAAALLEEQLVRLEQRFDCEQGAYRVTRGHVLHDHTPRGVLSFRDVITYSSNIGTVKAAAALPQDTFYGYLKAFGFGEPTGVELRGEIRGTLRPVSQWSKLSMMALPIGHEMGVTAIQMAAAVSTLANDGTWVRPRLVREVHAPDGSVIWTAGDPVQREVVSPETARTVRELMVGVVERGTGKPARIAGFSVGGKTGTAQKIEEDGRYSHSKFVGSFVGFAPADDPQFTIIVMIDEPRPVHFGSVVAAPAFAEVASGALAYRELPPDVQQPLLASAAGQVP